MLSGLRYWVNKFPRPLRPHSNATRPTASSQRAAQEARNDRASSVIQLQQEVRRLQQDITDLSTSLETGVAGTERTNGEAELTSLQTLLGAKQRELSKYQARI